jgi:endonuclease YncB( thermonuclease family)
VIDGDTIKVYHEPPDVRLVGFNAPETRRAACEAEAELGAKATGVFVNLLKPVISTLNTSGVLAPSKR